MQDRRLSPGIPAAARAIAAGVAGAAMTVLLQWAVRRFLPPHLHHLGAEIFGLTLLSLPVIGFVVGLITAPHWNCPILLRSILANPALYYWYGWMLVSQLPPFGAAPRRDLVWLACEGILLCALVWVATLVGLWLGRFRTLSEYERSRLCASCGYDLTGNTSGRCPECGRMVGRSVET